MSDLEYIRASSISSYLECSAKYYFQNIEQVQVYNKPALAFGSSVHKALEFNFSQKVNTRIDLPVEQVQEVFSQNLDNEFSNVEAKDLDEPAGVIKDNGIKLVEKYQKEHAYRIQPVMVEQKVNVKFKGLDYGLSGTIDLIDENGVLVDHKTTAKDVLAIPESYKIQVGGAYAFLVKTLTKKPVSAARIDFLVRKSTKATENKILPVNIPVDEQYFFNVFTQVASGIKNGIFIPNRQHMYCSRKYCKFWNICEARFSGKVRE